MSENAAFIWLYTMIATLFVFFVVIFSGEPDIHDRWRGINICDVSNDD